MAPPRTRRRACAIFTVLLLCSGVTLSACGNSNTSAHATIVKHACEQVSAVLSDGPDPGADPVGYAEAQIVPLGQIKVRDAVLQTGIDYLDATYRLFYVTNGSAAAQRSVAAALKIIRVYCPGIGA